MNRSLHGPARRSASFSRKTMFAACLAAPAVSNRNRRAGTNLLGVPTEPWGVSNNARPTPRAPRFDEAVFVVQANAGEVAIDVKVAP